MYSLTDFAAWTGAVVALFALLWNVYKELRSGARLSFRANPNMIRITGTGQRSEPKISLNVVNRGNLPTTLTSLDIFVYGNRLGRILDKIRHSGRIGAKVSRLGGALRKPLLCAAVNPKPMASKQNMPFVIKPGRSWTALVDQQAVLNILSEHDGKPVYLELGHATGGPVAVRLYPDRFKASS